MPRIYLDNAATSWPKPPGVAETIADYYRDCGAPAGRGVYSEAMEVQRKIDRVRALAANFINAVNSSTIVFTLNGTDSLNMVINGLLKVGDHAIATVTEHNSVLRPLNQLKSTASVASDFVECDSTGLVDPERIRAAIKSNTKLICINHASNVTGTIQPIAEIIAIAKRSDIPVLVDAAQTLGHLDINVQQLDCDYLAAPGHKGLLGPLGTGILYIKPGAEKRLSPLRSGGTGTRSFEPTQPVDMPDRFESGNLNVGGILALGCAIDFLKTDHADQLKKATAKFAHQLYERLASMSQIEVYGHSDHHQRVPLLSINCAQYDSREFAVMLDSAASVQSRPGFHCAPLMHKSIGTFDKGGTVRLSPGLFNTQDQIDSTLALIESLA